MTWGDFLRLSKAIKNVDFKVFIAFVVKKLLKLEKKRLSKENSRKLHQNCLKRPSKR